MIIIFFFTQELEIAVTEEEEGGISSEFSTRPERGLLHDDCVPWVINFLASAFSTAGTGLVVSTSDDCFPLSATSGSESAKRLKGLVVSTPTNRLFAFINLGPLLGFTLGALQGHLDKHLEDWSISLYRPRWVSPLNNRLGIELRRDQRSSRCCTLSASSHIRPTDRNSLCSHIQLWYSQAGDRWRKPQQRILTHRIIYLSMQLADSCKAVYPRY